MRYILLAALVVACAPGRAPDPEENAEVVVGHGGGRKVYLVEDSASRCYVLGSGYSGAISCLPKVQHGQ